MPVLFFTKNTCFKTCNIQKYIMNICELFFPINQCLIVESHRHKIQSRIQHLRYLADRFNAGINFSQFNSTDSR